MDLSRQGGLGEPTGSGASEPPSADPVAAVEAALGALRGRGPGGAFGPGGGFGPGGAFGWGPGGHPAGHDHGAPFGAHGHHDHDGPHRRGRPGHRGGPGGRGGHAAIRLLLALEHHGPSSVSDLADAVGVDQPRASRLAQAAVDAGHVRREVDPRDARRSILVITDAGRAALASLLDHRRSAVERALADFTPAEREQFARLFTRFAAGWRRD